MRFVGAMADACGLVNGAALELAIDLLDFPDAFALKSTCKGIASSPKLQQHTTHLSWREFRERRVMAGHDLDVDLLGSGCESPLSTPSLGFSIDSDGHWHEHRHFRWDDSSDD